MLYRCWKLSFFMEVCMSYLVLPQYLVVCVCKCTFLTCYVLFCLKMITVVY
ncbi:hypothetical protein BVRB_8g183740 [Beta vulgaris subsp. vulgaris]|nr:hypothetical protein BVRB_8g183740 [Beta vulgaris subsp. vulgaris]